MKDLKETVAEKLVFLRRENKLTQAELAEKLNYSDKSVSKWERGEALPDVEVLGDRDDADLLIVGFGGTYGHLHAAMDELRSAGKKVALAHFKYINPLPKNTAEVMKRYKKVVVAEQNMGQFAGYLRMKVDGFVPYQFNQVKGQPFLVNELAEAFSKLMDK